MSLPSGVHVLFAGYGEKADPGVIRTDMEKGVPRQRLRDSGCMVEVSATLLFDSPAAIEAFDDWYHDTLRRIAWFPLAHPRTGATTSMRFKGGDIGALVPRNPQFSRATRAVVLEYLR